MSFGPEFVEKLDGERLHRQHERIRNFMLSWHGGVWHTLSDIAQSLNYPEASVSANLRHLRKPEFGSHVVDKRRRVGSPGTWEYRVRTQAKGQIDLFDAPPAPAMRGH